MDQAEFLKQLQDHAKKHGNEFAVHYFIGYSKGELKSEKPSLKVLKALYAAYEQFEVQRASQFIPGYESLTEEQQELFEQVHARHMKAWGTENQRKYAKNRIINLLWDENEKCLKVYYDDVWWHYNTEGDWY